MEYVDPLADATPSEPPVPERRERLREMIRESERLGLYETPEPSMPPTRGRPEERRDR